MSEALHRPIEDPNSVWSSGDPGPISFRNIIDEDQQPLGGTYFGENTDVSIDRAEETFAGVTRTLSRTPQDVVSAEAGEGEFDLEKHLNAVVQNREQRGVPQKKLGLTFQNLSVFGESNDFQRISTVGNMLLGTLNFVPLIRNLFDWRDVVSFGQTW
ncbi:ATP-binding cassette transporter snq2 [Basidiobolus ranarum]|uniref:ATP-binding cassette transporter snq2 n=1 Tax=Basidiobolus ranarum TaxID=34480 RepID=A0ABR2VPC0_9FUNG